MTLLSFHGDESIKATYVARLRAHHVADEIVQGKYWENGKGCAVGCTIHGRNHKKFETELGIPEWLARLEDRIFEGLPNDEAKDFAIDFLEAIPVGVELEPVKWRFCAFLLRENIERVLALKDISDELKKQVVDAIRGVLAVYGLAIETGEWSESAWSVAESAARSATRSAAESARSAAESAARSAAESAWYAARSATRSAAESVAESAWSAAESAWYAARSVAESAWSAAYERYAEELLRILKSTEVK